MRIIVNLDEILSGHNSIALAGHVNPDGDAIGSTMGLYNYILNNYPETKVTVFLDNIPEELKFLSNIDHAVSAKNYENKDEVFSLFICLDCADAGRLADAFSYFKNAKDTFCIDHHISNNGFAKHQYIKEDVSSTCELVCDLIGKDKITKEIAECLYTGIVTDTGVFQYSCTSSHTMELAGMLMDKGIDYSWIVEHAYYEKTLVQNKLLGLSLSKAKVYNDGLIVATVLDRKDFESVGATADDTEGIVSQLRVTKGCEVALFLYQKKDMSYKGSLRCKGNYNMANIAASYGGGGHAKAAGFNLPHNINIDAEFSGILEKISKELKTDE